MKERLREAYDALQEKRNNLRSVKKREYLAKIEAEIEEELAEEYENFIRILARGLESGARRSDIVYAVRTNDNTKVAKFLKDARERLGQ